MIQGVKVNINHCEKKIYIWTCVLILNWYHDRAGWIYIRNSARLFSCLWVGMKSEVQKRNVDTWDDTHALSLGAATRLKKREINSDEHHAMFAYDLQSALIWSDFFNFCTLRMETNRLSRNVVRNYHYSLCNNL